MKLPIALLSLGFAASTSATDYGPFTVNLDPNYSQTFISANDPVGQVSYGTDSVTFTIPPQECFPGNGLGPYCWTYANQLSITVEGHLITAGCFGRGCTTKWQYVTMPGSDAVQLFAVDANGNQTPALDINGNPVPITYSPQNAGTINQIDRWVASGALASGTYIVTGVAGTACGDYAKTQIVRNGEVYSAGSCAAWGGSNTWWLAVFKPSYTYCSPYTNPPCVPLPHDD